MGSYLSVHNDTQNTVTVKVGPDEAALDIASIIGGSIAAVAATITGVGFSLGAVTGGLLRITLSTGFRAVATASTLQAGVTKVVLAAQSSLSQNGYTKLGPGENYISKRMTLSFWRQCHVIRIRNVEDGVEFKETHMHPIFSGAENNSTLTHNISFWVEKYPWKEVNFKL